MPLMRADLELGPYLDQVRREGVGFVPSALSETDLPRLLAELDALPATSPPDSGLADHASLTILPGRPADLPVLASLRDELVEAVRADGRGGLDGWLPDHIFVRRYDATSTGMVPHHDGERFGYLVATFTVRGLATFVRYDESGHERQTWYTEPGSLLLLRGPGLDGLADGRPLHAVGGPADGPRCSVAFRMSI